MFLDLDLKPRDDVAMRQDDDQIVTYGELVQFAGEFGEIVEPRAVALMLCSNSIGSVLGFLACVENGVVPLLVPETMEEDLISGLYSTYRPRYVWMSNKIADAFEEATVVYRRCGYSLVETNNPLYPLYDDLALLLPTSGSTGSPKLVRHCYENLNATARNVAAAFELSGDERALISLPMHFTQGLSTVTSNLLVGGQLLLASANMMQPGFWKLLEGATSITGVPYSYEVLCKMRFFERDWPTLRLLNEGGGKLPEHRFREIAEYADQHGKRFVASYGSTETTSRMAFLPSDLALSKTCSIGGPLPEGSIALRDDEGNAVLEPDCVGEIVYSGPNVTLGYAVRAEDLVKGDERKGVYPTGDLAYRDEDGCLFIVGRKNRFVKIYGFRIGLDEVESLVKNVFGVSCACVGNDEGIVVYIEGEDGSTEELRDQVRRHLVLDTKLRPAAIDVRAIPSLPKNDAGKIQYRLLSIE